MRTLPSRCDISGAQAFYQRLPAATRTLHFYEGLFHELFNELPADRAKVPADLNEWLVAVSADPIAPEDDC